MRQRSNRRRVPKTPRASRRTPPASKERQAHQCLRNSSAAPSVIRSPPPIRNYSIRFTTSPAPYRKGAHPAAAAAIFTSLLIFNWAPEIPTTRSFPRFCPISWNPGSAKARKRLPSIRFWSFLNPAKANSSAGCPIGTSPGKEARYGQHALCMERGQFDSLMEQAEIKTLEPV